MKASILRVKLLFRDDKGSSQDKCSLFHTSPHQQLGWKKCLHSRKDNLEWFWFLTESQDQESLKPSENFSSNSPNLLKVFFFQSLLVSWNQDCDERLSCLDWAKKNAEAPAGAGWRGGCHFGSHAYQKSTIAAIETIIFSAFLYSRLSCIKIVHVLLNLTHKL